MKQFCTAKADHEGDGVGDGVGADCQTHSPQLGSGPFLEECYLWCFSLLTESSGPISSNTWHLCFQLGGQSTKLENSGPVGQISNMKRLSLLFGIPAIGTVF